MSNEFQKVGLKSSNAKCCKRGLPRVAKSAILLAAVTAALLFSTESSRADVSAWNQWEQTLTSNAAYANPYHDATLEVVYAAPDGQTFKTYGFWDGGKTFKIRFMFPAAGDWSWKTTCSDPSNTGLHNQSGTVKVVAYTGDNPLYKNGYLKVSDNMRYLAHWNGKPFLWIGDTPWSVFITATQSEWEDYLHKRKSQEFSVVQVHCGGCWNWVGNLKTNRSKNAPFAGSGRSLQWNPAYWNEVDHMVQAANDLGILVYICAVRQPGPGFPIEDSSEVASFTRNLVARMMGRFVAFSPMADDLWTPQADVAGKAIRQATPLHLISVHPRFFLEPAIAAHGKDYVDFVGLQTGRGWTFDPYKKQTKTPYSQELAAQNAIEWPLILYKRTPIKPVINQEGQYDAPYADKLPRMPRSIAYWSFLSGAQGFTYGCGGIWNWGLKLGDPTRGFDYKTALNRPSATQMKFMADFFGAIPWWTLEPAHALVKNQSNEWMQKMVVAKSASGDLGVAYLPNNAEIVIDMKAFPADMSAKWFNPLTGKYEAVAGTIPATGPHAFARPAGWEDAVLALTKQ
jgi:hypothetical protein